MLRLDDRTYLGRPRVPEFPLFSLVFIRHPWFSDYFRPVSGSVFLWGFPVHEHFPVWPDFSFSFAVEGGLLLKWPWSRSPDMVLIDLCSMFGARTV